jgi:hypothetical protein
VSITTSVENAAGLTTVIEGSGGGCGGVPPPSPPPQAVKVMIKIHDKKMNEKYFI